MKKTRLIALILTMINCWPTKAQQDFSVNTRKLQYVLGAIDRLYVDTVDINKVTENAITNVLEELDPHSVYIPQKELQQANEPLEGSFEGIGIQFQMLEDTLFVIQTIAGCPAERVGIRAGDRMIEIEDSIIAGVKIQNSDIMRRLRGKKGTTVRVKMLRAGVPELIEFHVVRDKIPIYSLDAAYMVDKTIGYIKINNFGATTLDEFQKALSTLKKEGMKSLILDLQGNGGGYLNAAINLADEFLGKNKLIVYTQGIHQPKTTATATNQGDFEQGNLIVLIDETSASASEIVSGAVQDWDRGVLVGRRTFGKGLVQRQFILPDGSAIRLTTARYYTPTGRCIQKPYKGIDYQKDLETRYKHGELMHKDSIHFPDSLKYATLTSERTVYGGGGIMPDVFVPVDTTMTTTYHRNIIAKGVLNKFCVQYVDMHRTELKTQFPAFEDFLSGFSVSDDMLDELVSMGNEANIEYSESEFQRSKRLFSIQIKALIARDIWSMQEYYRVINELNNPLQKAIEIMKDKNLYASILGK